MPTQNPVKIGPATEHYEQWLAKRIPVVSHDLRRKHILMKRNPFSFLRATFYRWVQTWSVLCAQEATAPRVLSVGDLHLENFGTWRDKEGRLIWGINDFDEAYPLPYTSDLIRLAVSAKVAIAADHLSLKSKDACDAILTGYMEGLQSGGHPFVLSEGHLWLRKLATNHLRDSERRFWRDLQALPPVTGEIPQQVRHAFRELMPAPGLSYRLRRRVSGLGSRGRPRYVALAQWKGGAVAREAKALTVSACTWVQDGQGDTTLFYQSILDHAVRCPDPFVRILDNEWIVRRLAPDCSRIELASLLKKRDESRLLYAMGRETANVHLGIQKARHVLLRDLAKRKANWLRLATKVMTRATVNDWKEWVAR